MLLLLFVVAAAVTVRGRKSPHSIYNNSRSTAPAAVMLIIIMLFSFTVSSRGYKAGSYHISGVERSRRSRISRRPKAGQQGGVRGSGSPPRPIIIINIIIIINYELVN